ncbi:YkgJ family cysteine cluster protein [Desulfovulcanus sp.]
MSKKLAFDCKMCGQCCQGEGGIVVTDEEQKAIAKFLHLSLPVFRKKYIYSKSDKDFIQTDEDSFCIFFQKETGCLIHPVKPKVCRAWPFFRGNLVDKTSWEMAKEYCPGINPEVSFEEFIRQGLDYLQKHNLISKDSMANALKI